MPVFSHVSLSARCHTRELCAGATATQRRSSSVRKPKHRLDRRISPLAGLYGNDNSPFDKLSDSPGWLLIVALNFSSLLKVRSERECCDCFWRIMKMLASAQPRSHRDYVCGWIAAFTNIVVTFPINKVMFRQMVDGVKVDKALSQLKQEGLRNLYRGILPPLIAVRKVPKCSVEMWNVLIVLFKQKTTSMSIMFGSYGQYRKFLDKNCQTLLPYKLERLTIAALLAGTSEAVLLAPFERIQMLLQARQFIGKYRNTTHAVMEVRKIGYSEFYRGLTPILLRNGPSNVVFFGVKESVRGKFFQPTDKKYMRLFEDFVTGATLGALISTLFYPVNVVRTKMQTVPVGSKHLSIRKAAIMVWEERNHNIRKIYYGVHVNYTRSFLSWGIINMTYELMRRFLYSNDSNGMPPGTFSPPTLYNNNRISHKERDE